MASRPTIVTKHCDPKFWQGLLDGSVMIGSLSNYRKMESTNGLLDDKEEGISASDIDEDMIDFTGNLGGNSFKNCDFLGNGTSVRIQQHIDAHVYCLSSGPYSAARHKKLINGDDAAGYRANDACTAFVEYDLERLEYAISHLAALRFRPAPVLSDSVSYNGRERKIRLANHAIEMSDGALQLHARNSVFMKPSRFSCEEEHRIAFNVGAAECNPLLTTCERNDVRRNFAAAISNVGSPTL